MTGVLPNEGRKELGWRKRKLWCGRQSEGCEAAGACIKEIFGVEASWGMNRGANRDSEGLKGGERVQDKDGLRRAVEGADRKQKTGGANGVVGRADQQTRARRWTEAVETRN